MDAPALANDPVYGPKAHNGFNMQPAVVDFPHTWVAWSQDSAIGAVGRHGHYQNVSYTLVNSMVFFVFSRFWPTDLIAG